MPEISHEYQLLRDRGDSRCNLSYPKNVSFEVVGDSVMGSAGEEGNRLCRWLQHLQNIQLCKNSNFELLKIFNYKLLNQSS